MRYIDSTGLFAKYKGWGSGSKLWKNDALQEDFRKLLGPKCWYTECQIIGSDKPIDHFRPKGKVEPFKDYDYNIPLSAVGYSWLKNDYKNYRLCCTYANRKTGSGGKNAYFPLMSKIYLTANGNQKEEPALLDPFEKSDVGLLCFEKDTISCTKQDNYSIRRVEATKKIYNLEHSDFKQERVTVWESVERTLQRYKAKNITEDVCVEDLSSKTNIRAPFSACAIAAVKSLAPDNIKDQLDLNL